MARRGFNLNGSIQLLILHLSDRLFLPAPAELIVFDRPLFGLRQNGCLMTQITSDLADSVIQVYGGCEIDTIFHGIVTGWVTATSGAQDTSFVGLEVGG